MAHGIPIVSPGGWAPNPLICYDINGVGSKSYDFEKGCPLPLDAKRNATIKWIATQDQRAVPCATNQLEADDTFKNVQDIYTKTYGPFSYF